MGAVDRLGDGVSGIELGMIVAAMPIHGAYAEFVCLPQRELVEVPAGLDAGEAVSLILNYITAYQMMNRVATVRAGQRILIHGASGGVGTARTEGRPACQIKKCGAPHFSINGENSLMCSPGMERLPVNMLVFRDSAQLRP